MEILFFANCQKTRKTSILCFTDFKKPKKAKIYYLQTLKIELKKMDFNFANCVKLAKRILFLGNFEKLKKKKTRI